MLPRRVDLRALYAFHVEDQRDLGCHDDKTEVLTETGWQQWPNYDGRSLLATMNPINHMLEFQEPIALQRYEYDGPMYYSQNARLDFSLTPNHRMFVRPWVQSEKTLSDSYAFKRIDEIGWYAGLPASTSGFVGTELKRLVVGDREYDGGDFIALISLIISDGWTAGTDNNKNKVSFCCFREDRIHMVRALAHRLGLREQPSRPGVWTWTDGGLSSWLKTNIYTGDVLRSPFKKVPDLIKCASEEQIKNFLEFFGDQHITKGNRQFYSSSYRLVDDLQELLMRVGKRSSIYERVPRSVQMKDGRQINADNCVTDITLTEWNTDALSITRKKQLYEDHYKGDVFCATVPNSTLITRRNGKILISGNSCTGEAVTTGLEAALVSATIAASNPRHDTQLSPLWLYARSRIAQGTPLTEDSGCALRDVIKVASKEGCPLESSWPYDTSKFAVTPPTSLTDEALKYQALFYFACPSDFAAMASLAQTFPVIFGMDMFDSQLTAAVMRSGRIAKAQAGEVRAGGHAMVKVGYDQDMQIGDDVGAWLVLNSWGEDVGEGGYFWVSFACRTRDCWTIRRTG